MNKILLIIKREYLTRVKKKSFLIVTLVVPLLMAGVMVVPALLMMYSGEKKLLVEVVDNSFLYDEAFESNGDYTFIYGQRNLDSVKVDMNQGKLDAVVYIPMPDTVGMARGGANPRLTTDNFIYSKDGVSIDFSNYVESGMEREVEKLKLTMSGVDPKLVEAAKTRVKSNTLMVDDEGNEKTDVAFVKLIVGYISAFAIYMLVLLFGSAVMTGVNEEKQGRVVEVIISSVKPFELMMGKIIGVGLVGVTQFMLWILLSTALITGFGAMVSNQTTSQAIAQMQVANSSTGSLNGANMTMMPSGTVDSVTVEEQAGDLDFMQNIADSLNSVNFTILVFSFLFYFLFGYLMYAALFAAVGAAVDSQTDMQQFSTPITIPLIIAIVCMMTIVKNPDSTIAMILSFFPLTSPVIMMARIPFGVPAWEIAVSMLLLILGFLLTTWFAAKIYRTGLLMYGKKITWSELMKWIKY